MPEDPKEIGFLERMLDDYNPQVRSEALTALLERVGRGQIFLPPPGNETNVHSHTFFSFRITVSRNFGSDLEHPLSKAVASTVCRPIKPASSSLE